MFRNNQNINIFISIILVAWITFFAPTWLSLYGIGPCWVVLLLLPFSLKKGESFGSFFGLMLGLLLDGISLNSATNIPILIFLGFWWGRLGRRGSNIKQSLALGLLAFIGSISFGISLLLQMIIFNSSGSFLIAWGIKNLLAQSFVTGLLAPIVCSWCLLYLDTNSSAKLRKFY